MYKQLAVHCRMFWAAWLLLLCVRSNLSHDHNCSRRNAKVEQKKKSDPLRALDTVDRKDRDVAYERGGKLDTTKSFSRNAEKNNDLPMRGLETCDRWYHFDLYTVASE